jgi:hypothetical protein
MAFMQLRAPFFRRPITSPPTIVAVTLFPSVGASILIGRAGSLAFVIAMPPET